MPTPLTSHDTIDWSKSIILQSNDLPNPLEFEVSREAAMMSGLIRDLLEDHPDNSEAIIPIPNVSGKTLSHVLEYIEYHHTNRATPIEKPLRNKIEDVVCAWDREFLFRDLVKNHDERQHEVLIDVIMAAN
eukprot:Tbor_TRINITY_DN5467_c6_g1::TRINITY_DN5467_c6_g1_i5::g.24726::m.24726/K03094/SKP1, CBF3D; S-phase kinase-associated protein 1